MSAAVLVLAGGCGDDNEVIGGEPAPTTAAATTTTLAPQRGGVVTVGQFSREPGLDPVKNAGGGTVGSIELMAIYDVLMRWNSETGKYEPRTAESLTPNADYSVWTLKVRPNIKFTDGTPYDANAVKFVHDRQLAEATGGPKNQLQTSVAKVEVVDSLTVRYTLTKPWVGFPFILSGVNGLIYSPAAQQKAGATFNTAPGDAGAGPFKVKSYKPGEAVELERNPNYWGGDVYLDGLKFVLIAGAAPTYDAIKTGTLSAGFIRSNATYVSAKRDGYGIIDLPGGKNLVQLNAAKGPTANVKVRQAIAHAIDPKVIVDRVYTGVGQPNSAPFTDVPLDPKVEGRKYDQAEARRLIGEAKAEGWDGKIRIIAPNTPEGTAWGQAVQTMLQAVGMDVGLDTSKDTQSVVAQVAVQRDYDITMWSYSLPSDENDYNYLQLAATFGNKAYGYGPDDLVAAIDKLRTATSDQDRIAAYKAISEIWVRDVPAVPTTTLSQALLYSPKLHGVARTAVSSVLFDKAWLER